MATITFAPASILPSETAPITAVFSSFVTRAGETLVAGDWVYKKTSDGLYWKADNSTAEKSTVAGLVANGATAGQRFNLIIRDTALPVGGYALQGRLYALSATAGKMCDVIDVAETPDIFLLSLAQGDAPGGVMRFDCSTPKAGIQND